MKKLKIIIIFFSIITISYIFISSTIVDNPRKFFFIKKIIPDKYISKIKYYIFPHSVAKFHKSQSDLYFQKMNDFELMSNEIIVDHDLLIKNNLMDFVFLKNSEKKISENLYLEIFSLKENKFQRGVALMRPGSAYIDFYKGYVFIASTIGIIGFAVPENGRFYFKQIKNNIDSFLKVKNFKKDRRIGIKDIKIFNDTIFVSYLNELSKDCWNTSVLKAKLNLKELIFEKFFEPKDCVNEFDDEFKNSNDIITFSQTGGRITKFGENYILLTTGEFRLREGAQKKNSSFGKILKINLKNSDFRVISMGHRNPQGLYFDKDNNYILSSEHGAWGGDEINLIKINEKEIQNFGWAQASYSEHYCGGKDGCLRNAYKKYPLLKSHKENGYIEPIKHFTPSVGPSEIIKIKKKTYILSTMKDKSIFIFNLNDKNEIRSIERIPIGERIRDMFFNNETKEIYLSLENSTSLGIINLSSMQ